MSDLFQQGDEVDNTVEKEYFPDNLFGKSPAKKVTTLRRKVNRELQTEESKYASHLKEELNILDKFRQRWRVSDPDDPYILVYIELYMHRAVHAF